jgi:asparagine N-glycosylation enzyme membrane subunit Stt3
MGVSSISDFGHQIEVFGHQLPYFFIFRAKNADVKSLDSGQSVVNTTNFTSWPKAHAGQSAHFQDEGVFRSGAGQEIEVLGVS